MALSAVEFALCVLSMFGRVLDENRMAVQVLLEAIKSYNTTTRQFGKRAVKEAGYGGRSSLRAMAKFLGQDYNMKELRTDEASLSPSSPGDTETDRQGAQAVLHTILDPVIGCLTRQELVNMCRDMDEAMRLASSVPMEEVRTRVAEFGKQARENGCCERWVEVWEKGIQSRAMNVGQPLSIGVEATEAELACKFAMVPVMSTIKRRAHVARNCRPRRFPSATDVCLGLNWPTSSSSSSSSTSSSGSDDTRIWHAHGWKMFHPATAANRKRTDAMGFKFPPPGMISSTESTPATTPTPSGVDSEPALDMSEQLKQWQDDWETEQFGAWKAAIGKDNALWFIAGTRNKKMWHKHGWKKFDATARSAHKKTSFRFPASGSPCTSSTTSDADSVRSLDADAECKHRKWEDSWEAEQVGKWTAGLKVPVKREEAGVWKRLAMAWKSEKVDIWAGMEWEEADEVETTGSTSLAAKVGRLFGFA
ncbi:hypothetical protein RSOLAG22IIIB_05357 [Rhizoctonia solani]|uniref:Uncharacterized protein n=1 Tax=Rhizoctonia solani TaxID=456999 RepID=A0A0K6G6B3_9AGAM|nr:hypothetical protein RSOLAG22IIIB_05357 [Rhizoctonia solani]